MAMGKCAVHLTTTLGRATDLSVVACLPKAAVLL